MGGVPGMSTTVSKRRWLLVVASILGVVALVALAMVVRAELDANSSWQMATPEVCDPPPSAATDVASEASWAVGQDWFERWRDETACAVRADVLFSTAGASHCNWESIRFLYYDDGRPVSKGSAPYVRDRHGILTGVSFEDSFAKLDEVPPTARDSGYRRGDWALWIDEQSPERVYLVGDGAVERWPRAAEPVGCA
jgi:hypothetical protein